MCEQCGGLVGALECADCGASREHAWEVSWRCGQDRFVEGELCGASGIAVG